MNIKHVYLDRQRPPVGGCGEVAKNNIPQFDTVAEKARRYLAHMPIAVQGQAGNAATFRAASALTNDFGMTEEQALQILSEWNQACRPPWQDAELRKIIRSAATKPHSRPRGCLLRRGEPTGTTFVPPIAPMPSTPRHHELPAMRKFSAGELEALANLRGLGTEGLEHAQEDGLLRFGYWQNAPTWFVTDAGAPWSIAQARRMDGQRWAKIDAKAWTICEAGLNHAHWPIGTSLIGNKPAVALCEGGPDLLAAYHFRAVEGAESDCQPVTMLGAALGIHPEALPLFSKRHVRMFLDNDAAGIKAGRNWAAQLKTVGATVDWFSYDGYTTSAGEPIKDSNDLAHMSADTFEMHRGELENILPRGTHGGN